MSLGTASPCHASRVTPAVERIRHIQDSQGQILGLAFRSKPFKSLELFPSRSEEGGERDRVLEGANFPLDHARRPPCAEFKVGV